MQQMWKQSHSQVKSKESQEIHIKQTAPTIIYRQQPSLYKDTQPYLQLYQHEKRVRRYSA